LRRSQFGQAMAEYLVVSTALIGAFFWTANTDCPGYDNCLSNLLTVMHNKYEGYSNSMTAVHRYGEFRGEGYDSTWTDGGGGGGDGGGGGGGGDIPQDGLIRSDTVTSLDGGTTYGTLIGGQYVVDGDGNVIGTYNGVTGVVTLDSGVEYDALVSQVVVDEDGNPAELQAVVICGTTIVLGFGYESGVTGDFHGSLTLEQIDISPYCTLPTYAIVDTDGVSSNGAIVGSEYYASTLSVEINAGTQQVASGDVVYFNIEVPDDEDLYAGSDPGIGEQVVDCAILVTGWDGDPDAETLDTYLNADPNPRVGSLDPDLGVPCPAVITVTD